MDESINVIELYKTFGLPEKRKLLSDEYFELLAVIKKMKNDFKLSSNDPENNIPKKLYVQGQTEEEYLNALYENIINIKEELADLLSVVVDNLYE